jgi:hypothetical protein
MVESGIYNQAGRLRRAAVFKSTYDAVAAMWKTGLTPMNSIAVAFSKRTAEWL